MTRTIRSQTLRRLGLLLVIAAAYFVAGRLGLRFAVVNPNATAVWPPAGIALAALLLAGYEVWPAIMAGAFLVHLSTTGSVPIAVAIAAGNTLEGLLGAYLVNRFARGRRVMDRARDIFTLALLAGIVSTAVSATAGVLAISLDGQARWSDFGSIWLTWWLGDAVGDLVVAPAVLLWTLRPRVHWTRRQTLEAAALLLCIGVVGSRCSTVCSPGGAGIIRSNSCVCRCCSGPRSGSSRARPRRPCSSCPASPSRARWRDSGRSRGRRTASPCCWCRRSRA